VGQKLNPHENFLDCLFSCLFLAQFLILAPFSSLDLPPPTVHPCDTWPPTAISVLLTPPSWSFCTGYKHHYSTPFLQAVPHPVPPTGQNPYCERTLFSCFPRPPPFVDPFFFSPFLIWSYLFPSFTPPPPTDTILGYLPSTPRRPLQIVFLSNILEPQLRPLWLGLSVFTSAPQPPPFFFFHYPFPFFLPSFSSCLGATPSFPTIIVRVQRIMRLSARLHDVFPSFLPLPVPDPPATLACSVNGTSTPWFPLIPPIRFQPPYMSLLQCSANFFRPPPKQPMLWFLFKHNLYLAPSPFPPMSGTSLWIAQPQAIPPRETLFPRGSFPFLTCPLFPLHPDPPLTPASLAHPPPYTFIPLGASPPSTPFYALSPTFALRHHRPCWACLFTFFSQPLSFNFWG